VNAAAERFLSQTESAFDVVFLDPPFADGLLGKAIQILEEKALLSPQAWVYLEQDSAHDWSDVPENWEIHREGDAGQAAFRLIKRNG
jgi:16S rRNA (guanine966-N2)-methyltransferase